VYKFNITGKLGESFTFKDHSVGEEDGEEEKIQNE